MSKKFINPIRETETEVVLDKQEFKRCLSYVSKIKKDNKRLRSMLKYLQDTIKKAIR